LTKNEEHLTKNSKDFVSAIETLAVSVDAFHRRFGIPQIDMASVEGTLDALRQRLSLLDEEVGEHARALNRGEIEEAVKEAVDVAYIALGTIHRLGADGVDACHEVAHKNDAKSPSAYSKRSATGKVLMD
jgi:NTP pyrophosphatase (non-canonical NTP hydrolase)